MTTTTNNKLKESYENLLFGYAAGTLDEAQNLIVATHLTLSNKGRNFVHHCENLGGALIETECEPVAMADHALQNVLERLDTGTVHAEKTGNNTFSNHEAFGFDIPKPLQDSILGQSVRWATLFPGMKAYDIKLGCEQSIARFMKADPGHVSPHHKHGGMEITLVLDGAFSDETGHYDRGDLVVTDEHCDHTPKACPTNGCVCLVVTSEPIKLTGIASLLNPFLKP